MSSNPSKITGGCHCGAIRYEATEPPKQTGTCHCRTCKKSTGSAFMVIAGFSLNVFRFTKGEPKRYRSAPIMEKGFCSNCGSLLYDRYLVRVREVTSPDVIWVQLGTLDNPEPYTIDFHYSVETQLPWLHFDDDARRMRCDEDPEMAAAFEAAETGVDYSALQEIELAIDRGRV